MQQRRFWVGVVAVVFGLSMALSLGGCSKKKGCWANSVGNCVETVNGAAPCNVEVKCHDGSNKEFKCSPPFDKAPYACECFEEQVSKKKVSLQVLLSKTDDAMKTAGAACGWPLESK